MTIEWKQFVIHPLSLSTMSAFMLTDSVTTDLIIYQTCKTIPSLNKSQCDLLHTNSSSDEAMAIEKLVQPLTTYIFIIQSCIDTILPSIMSLFLGPWSDKNGRKPLLLFPFIGYFLYFALMSILSYMNMSPYWFLLPSVPAALMGGYPVVLLTFFCYITDVTNEENRMWNLACLEISYIFGLLFGQLSGPVIFKKYGYSIVYLTSSGITMFMIFYTIVSVKETITNENGRNWKRIFDVSLLKELFRVVTKKRDGFDRLLVCCGILAMAMCVVVYQGNSSIAFLFTSSRLGWNISDFSYCSATLTLISIFGMNFLIKIVGSILKLPETIIIIIACLSSSAANLIKAFAKKPLHMYLSVGVEMFSASAIPVIRTILSKSVGQKDAGKIFSISTVMEMVVPFATTPIYIYVYNHTSNIFPYPVWLISAVLPFITISLTIIIGRRWTRLKNTQNYTQFVSNEN